jgi:hypothetical protein
MSIEFTCPSCREWVSVSESLAGLHGRCPRCSASVPVPDSPRASGGALERGWEAPRRPWYDEDEDRDRREYAPPRRDDYGLLSGGSSDPGWQIVRHGVNLEFIAVVIVLCLYAVFFLLRCGVLTVGPGMAMGGGGMGLVSLLELLAIVLVLGAIAALILMVVGQIMCCLAPGGTKGLAIASIACFGGTVLLGFAAIAVGAMDRFGPRSAGPGVALLLLAGVLALASFILHLLFLRAVAVSFGNYPLGNRVITYLVVSLVLAVGMVVFVEVLFADVARRGMVVGVGDGRGVLLMVTLVQGVVVLILLAWLSSLLAQVRDGIGRSRSYWRDDYGV